MPSPNLEAWRSREARLRLKGEVCPHCQQKVFPPRDICPNCSLESKTKFQFSGRGEVYSYTKIFDPPEGYEYLAPYFFAIVKLEEGPMVEAQLTDLDRDEQGKQIPLNIGEPVEMVTRKGRDNGNKGTIDYIYKFRPLLVTTG